MDCDCKDEIGFGKPGMECDRDGHENADKMGEILVQASVSLEGGNDSEKVFAEVDFLVCGLESHLLSSRCVFSQSVH